MKTVNKILFVIIFFTFIVSEVNAQYNYNQAAIFNGTTSSIAIPNTAKFNPGAITIEAWIYPKQATTIGYTIINNLNITGNGYELSLSGTNGLGTYLHFYNSAGHIQSTNYIRFNMWTHVAVTYNGINSGKMYINGIEDGTGTMTGFFIPSNIDSLTIGVEKLISRNNYFNGMIDDVRIWNTALSATTIWENRFTPLGIAKNGAYYAGRYANLVAAYRLNNDGSGHAYDEVYPYSDGNAIDITYKDYSNKLSRNVDYNNAVFLEGTTSYLAARNYVGQNSTTGITLEAWIYRNISSNPYMAIINKSGSTNRMDYGLSISNTGTLLFGTNSFSGVPNNTTISYTSPVLQAEHIWTHVAATYNSSTGIAKLYVNGDSVASKTFTGNLAIPNNPDSLFIGGFGSSLNSGYLFAGSIDEARNWYNTVRTSVEIKSNMFKNINYTTPSAPANYNLGVFGFNGKNYNELENISLQTPEQIMNFRGEAFITQTKSSNLPNSPMLRDDANDFAGATYATSYKKIVIPDAVSSGITDSIYIGSQASVINLKVFVLISHTRVSDLFLRGAGTGITLTGPTGISVQLLPAVSGVPIGVDLNTVFNMNADSVISSDTKVFAPYSPSVQPSNSFAVFSGTQRQGWWKIKIVDSQGDAEGILNGWGVQTSPSVGIEPVNNIIPLNYELAQNFPNPFNPSTKINFSLPKESVVKLAVYDLLGKEVEVLVNDMKKAGSYSLEFNAGRLSSGIYFYKLETNGFIETKKMMLVK